MKQIKFCMNYEKITFKCWDNLLNNLQMENSGKIYNYQKRCRHLWFYFKSPDFISNLLSWYFYVVYIWRVFYFSVTVISMFTHQFASSCVVFAIRLWCLQLYVSVCACVCLLLSITMIGLYEFVTEPVWCTALSQ